MQLNIDFTVPVIDNYGDMGFALHLACIFFMKNTDIHVRFWTEDSDLFHKIFPRELLDKISTNTGIELRQLDTFEESIKYPLRCNFFGYTITDTSLDGCQLCVNFDYLQFSNPVTDISIQSFHKTTYLQNSTKVVHFMPTLSLSGGGILAPLTSYLDDTTNLLSNTSPVIEVNRQNQIGIFVYPQTLVRIFPIIEKFPHRHFVIFGVPNPAQYNFPKNTQILPLLDLLEFEKALSACQRCFVRGENSLIFALQKKIPLLWDIYKESNGVHFDKMNDFVSSFGGEVNSAYTKALLLQSATNSTQEESVSWEEGISSFFEGNFDTEVVYYPKSGNNLFAEVSQILSTEL